MLKISAFIAVIILNALVLNQVLKSHAIIKKTSYFTMVIFILLSLPIIYIENYWIIIISNFLLVLIFNELLNLADSNEPSKQVFNSSFLVGLMCVFHFSLAIYYFLINFSIGYYKKYNLKRFIIQNIGFVLPFIIFYSSVFFINIDPLFFKKHEVIISNPFKNHIVSISYMLLMLTIASIELIINFHKKKIKSKQAFFILVTMMTLSLCPILIWELTIFAYLAIIPITIIITNYLIYTRYTRFRTFLVGLWIVLCLFDFFNL